MIPAFLDEGEVEQLTGYRMPAKQIEWLRDQGIPHYVNARGRPVVRRDLHQEAPRLELGPVR